MTDQGVRIERLERAIERLERANERLSHALGHVVNRVSTEGRDDEHGLIFHVGKCALEWAEWDRRHARERARTVASTKCKRAPSDD